MRPNIIDLPLHCHLNGIAMSRIAKPAKSIADRLRATLVALLALTLLLGPCLSINGLTGSGSAHAHGVAAESASDAHATGHHAHRAETRPAHHSNDGGSTTPGCEEMCDGWAVQKSKRDLSIGLAVHQKSTGVEYDGGDSVVLTTATFSFRPPDARRSPVLLSPQNGWLAALPGYAATNRYRL